MTDSATHIEPSIPSALTNQSGFTQQPGNQVNRLITLCSRATTGVVLALVNLGAFVVLGLPLLFLLRRLPFDVPDWLDFLGCALFLWAGLQLSYLFYARLFRRALARRFPDGRIPPTCLRCGYSLAGLPDDRGWRICPECNHKSPDRICIKIGRMLSVLWWPQIRERTD